MKSQVNTPPRLDYASSLEAPIVLSWADYTVATIGAMITFCGAFMLCAVGAWMAGSLVPDSLAIPVLISVPILSLAAAVHSFRLSLKDFRIKERKRREKAI
jgi:hypothetical protein